MGARVGLGLRHQAQLTASLPLGDRAVPAVADRGVAARPLPSHICTQHVLTLCSGVVEEMSLLSGAVRAEPPLASADRLVARLLAGTVNG